MDEERFWIDFDPDDKPFEETYAVIDEEEGGIIAYFGSITFAWDYIKFRKNNK